MVLTQHEMCLIYKLDRPQQRETLQNAACDFVSTGRFFFFFFFFDVNEVLPGFRAFPGIKYIETVYTQHVTPRWSYDGVKIIESRWQEAILALMFFSLAMEEKGLAILKKLPSLIVAARADNPSTSREKLRTELLRTND